MSEHTERIAKALEERGIGDIEARAIAPLVEAAIEAGLESAAIDSGDKRDGWAAALSVLEGKEQQ